MPSYTSPGTVQSQVIQAQVLYSPKLYQPRYCIVPSYTSPDFKQYPTYEKLEDHLYKYLLKEAVPKLTLRVDNSHF